MSKAFTREDDASELAPIRPLPTLPPGVKNYITPKGAENLRVDLSGAGPVKSVRSLVHGALPLANGSVIIPKLAEIDLLLLE